MISKSNPNLVIGCQKGSKLGPGAEVLIQQKNKDEPGQFWKIGKNKGLVLMTNPNLCLSLSNSEELVLSKIKSGKTAANQKFSIDKFGGIQIFQADQMEIDIAACIKSGVCTYTGNNKNSFINSELDFKCFLVTNDEKVEQSGFLEDRLEFCSVCAAYIPGRPATFKIYRSFSCIMGQAEKDENSPRISPFKYIERPNLRGNAAKKELENIENLLETTSDAITSQSQVVHVRR